MKKSRQRLHQSQLYSCLTILSVCAVLFFLRLGCKSLWGSEGRWAEVVRQMFLSSDFFHPKINGEPYFDKPLFTYWAIALVVSLTGKLNEFVARVPSALSGLFSVFATYWIGFRLWGTTVALLASMILATSFGFVFWSRTAAADAENVAFIMAAVCWFLAHRERTGFLSYLGFYLICAEGCQFKGLTAAAVPAVAVLCHGAVHGGLRTHLNWRNLLALVAGALFYVLPFVFARATSVHYGQEGLALAFRENIVRFFHAFDHREPFYVYFIYVPYLMLPWTIVLPFWVMDRGRAFRRITAQDRWILVTFASIFLLFTLSSSRRSYYILPILPFAALGIASFLTSPCDEQKRRISLTLLAMFMMAAGMAALSVPLMWPVIERVTGYVPPPGLSETLITFGIPSLSVALYSFYRYRDYHRSAGSSAVAKALALAFSAAIVLTGFFCSAECLIERDRPLKPFVLKLRDMISDIPSSRIAMSKNMASVSFYLGRREPVVNLERNENIGPFARMPQTRVVVTRKKDWKRLRPFFSGCRIEKILDSPAYSWDKRADKRLEALKIEGRCSPEVDSR